MNRTVAFLKSSLASLISQIINMVVGFITPRIMLQAYGSEINGLTSSILQFVSYFSMVEAGLGVAIAFSLYSPLANKDYNRINSVLSAAKLAYTQSGIIFTTLIFIFSILYPIFVTVDALDDIAVFIMILLLSSTTILDFFSLSKYRVLLTASQRSYIITFSSVIQVILNTVIIIIFGRIKTNILILRTLTILPIIVRNLIMYIYVRRSFPYIDLSVEPDKMAIKKRWDALYLQIAEAIKNGAPIVLGTVFCELELLSVYAVYNMIVGGVNGLLTIFSSGSTAMFGDVIAHKNTNLLRKTANEYQSVYYAILSILFSIAIVTILPFISIYTSGITDAVYYLPVFAVLFVSNGYISSLTPPYSMLMSAAGKYREMRPLVTVQVIISVVLGIILAYFFGLYGIVMSSIICNLFTYIANLVLVKQHVISESLNKISTRLIRWTLFFTFFVFLGLYLSGSSYMPSGYTTWIVYALVAAFFIAACAFILLLIFERRELAASIRRFKNVIIH